MGGETTAARLRALNNREERANAMLRKEEEPFDLDSISITSSPSFLRGWKLFSCAITWTLFHYYLTYYFIKGIRNGAHDGISFLSLRMQGIMVFLHWGLVFVAVYCCLRYYQCVKFHVDHMEEFPRMYEDHNIQATLIHEDLKNYRLHYQLFGAVFLAPFRSLFGILFMLLTMIMIGIPQKICGNRFKKFTSAYTCRMLKLLAFGGLWLIGICEIKTVYLGEKPKSALTVISNHIGLLDVMYMNLHGSFSFVCKRSLEKAPFIGSWIRALHCIIVDRDSSQSRKNAFIAVRDRMQQIQNGSENMSLVVYPEGTTTNGNVLLPFRSGAFGAMLPLHPLILVLNYSYLNITFNAYPWEWWATDVLCSPFPASLIAYWLPAIQQPTKEEVQLKGERQCIIEYTQKAHGIMRHALMKLNPRVNRTLMMTDVTAVPPSFKKKAIARLYGPVMQKHYGLSDEDLKITKI